MSDECREAFEKWIKENDSTALLTIDNAVWNRGNYFDDSINAAWEGWQAAWNTRPQQKPLAGAELVEALKAIAQGYPIKFQNDDYNFIQVSNPKFEEDNGESPYLVIDIAAISALPKVDDGLVERAENWIENYKIGSQAFQEQRAWGVIRDLLAALTANAGEDV